MKQVLNKFRTKWCLLSYFSLPAKLLLIQSGIFGPIRAHRGGSTILSLLVEDFQVSHEATTAILKLWNTELFLHQNLQQPDCITWISQYAQCIAIVCIIF